MATTVRNPDRERKGLGFFASNDPIFLGAFLALILFGMIAIFSVSSVGDAEVNFRRHLMLFAVGIVPFALFRFTPVEVFKRITSLLYVVGIALLGLVLVAGETNKGAQRWLDIGPIEVQPSELAKLGVTLTLAAFWAKRQDTRSSLGTYFLSLLHIVPFIILMGLQPHFGGALTIFVVWLAIGLVAGMNGKHVLITLVAGVTLFAVALNSNFVFHDYHRERLQNIFSSDESDAGYQQKQSELAFGLGGVGGSGLLRGEQKASGAIPEQHNDFILSVIGEELGFIGTTLVLLAYGVFLIRGWLLMTRIIDPFSRFAAQGILALIAMHMMVNIQMVLGIGPVVGLWLPFISHGSSAMWLCLMCVGFLLNVFSNTDDTMFSHSGRAMLAAHDRRKA